jgi:hypothetical protein
VALLYSNENFPLPVVQALRDLGHDVATIQERGKASEAVPDPEVLGMAVSEGRAILTLNRKDFIRLHKQAPDHAGIVVCTVDPDFAAQAKRIHEAIEACSDLKKQLLRVNRPGK